MELHRPAGLENGRGESGRVESGRVHGPLITAPPIRRTPMGPAGWPDPILVSLLRGVRPRPVDRSAATNDATDTAQAADAQLTRAATARRTIFTILALLQTVTFSYYMTTRIL